MRGRGDGTGAGAGLMVAPTAALALHDLGGVGDTALLVHAAGFHGRVWGPVAARLGNRVRAWGLDLRGHGDSGPCDTPSDWVPFGHDVLSAAGELDRPVIGIGHSLGAASLLLAELAAPGTFSRLVLYEPAVLDPTTIGEAAPARYAAAARRRRAEFADRTRAYENFAAKPPTSAFDDEVLRAYTTHGFRPRAGAAVRLKCEPATEAAIYEADGPRQVWDRLAPIAGPVTLVRGDESDVWTPAAADAVAERIGAAVEILPGVGHFGPQQRPGAFADLVRSILDRGGSR